MKPELDVASLSVNIDSIYLFELALSLQGGWHRLWLGLHVAVQLLLMLMVILMKDQWTEIGVCVIIEKACMGIRQELAGSNILSLLDLE